MWIHAHVCVQVSVCACVCACGGDQEMRKGENATRETVEHQNHYKQSQLSYLNVNTAIFVFSQVALLSLCERIEHFLLIDFDVSNSNKELLKKHM